MTVITNPDYDPGFLNSPGKGQSPTNPLAPVFIKSLGIVDDLSVYKNIFSGGTVNSNVGFTLGSDNFFGLDGFQVNSTGVFKEDVYLAKDIIVARSIVMDGKSFRPTVIDTRSGKHLVLAAY